MANYFLDAFTDTNGTNLGSHTPDTGTGWTNHPTWNSGAAGAIQTNRHYGGVTDSHWHVDDDAPGSVADYRVGATTFNTLTNVSFFGVYLFARMSTSVKTGYYFRTHDNSGGRLQLGKFVAGTDTQLANLSASYGTYVALNMELVVEGTTIEAFAQIISSGLWILSNGTTTATKTACFSVTDSAITAAGRAGINATNSTPTSRSHVDSFFAETLSSEFEESVSSAISFSSVANTEYLREIESTISFVSTALRILTAEVEHVLTLGSIDGFFNVEDDRQVPESILALTHSVVLGSLLQSVPSAISFVSTADFFLLETQVVEHAIALNHQATVVFGVPHSAPWGVANLTQNLGFNQNLSRAPSPSATSTIAFTHNAVASYGLQSAISFTQLAIGALGHGVESEIGFTTTVSSAGSQWLRSASSAMALTSAGNGFELNDKCGRRYGTTGPIAPGSLTLFSQDGQYSIVLRNPEIDNVRRTAFDRVLRETRGGDLIVFRDTNWNVVQTLLFTIVALKRTTLDSLQTFLLNTLGEEIFLVDWLGEEWIGVVTKPDETFTEDREGFWTFAFEFEGSKQEGSSAYQYLGLTQAVEYVLVP